MRSHRKIFAGAVALITWLLVASISVALAQGSSEQSRPQVSSDKAGSASLATSCEDMRSMMAEHKKEMARMDDRLATLLAAMETAGAENKLGAVEAVVKELAEQRIHMHQQMMAMHARGMQHTMEHMQSGDVTSMQNCPMMKPSNKETEPGAHSEHHGSSDPDAN